MKVTRLVVAISSGWCRTIASSSGLAYGNTRDWNRIIGSVADSTHSPSNGDHWTTVAIKPRSTTPLVTRGSNNHSAPSHIAEVENCLDDEDALNRIGPRYATSYSAGYRSVALST